MAAEFAEITWVPPDRVVRSRAGQPTSWDDRERKGAMGMPLIALLRVCLRRWYVVLLGVALTVGAAYVVHDRPGVYYSQVQLVLIGPPQTYYPNTVAVQPFALAP